jgi:hypothetical protein
MHGVSELLVTEVREALEILIDGHRSGDTIVRLEAGGEASAEVRFDGARRWRIALEPDEAARAWAESAGLEIVDNHGLDLDSYGTPGLWISHSEPPERGLHRVVDLVAGYFAHRGVEEPPFMALRSHRQMLALQDEEGRQDRIIREAARALQIHITPWGMLGIAGDGRLEEICQTTRDEDEAVQMVVEYLREDGAEQERWFGPEHNQFYWDISRRCAITAGNQLGAEGDLNTFCFEFGENSLFIDVGVVEDPDVTWHGLWVRSFCWAGWLLQERLRLTVNGEPLELELRAHTAHVDHSALSPWQSRGLLCEERSIFNAPSGLLRKIARARAVRARLEGHNGSIEKEFTRRNIARVRKFVRDNLVGDALRPDAGAD